MTSDRSRRALLRGAGLAAVVGIAGCGGRPNPETATQTTPSARTYSFEVQNEITSRDLSMMPHVSESTPAKVRLFVYRIVDGSTEGTLFERELALDPETSKTLDDAFTTDPDGPTYDVNVELEQFTQGRGPGERQESYRFDPGEYNTPEDDTFEVTVRDRNSGEFLMPEITLQDRTTRRR